MNLWLLTDVFGHNYQDALLVSIWHDDPVVLGAHVALHPLAIGIAPLVNVLPGLVSANKTGNKTLINNKSYSH